jgi:signal transduction histidine kinase
MAKLMISNLDAYQIKDAGLLKLIKVCEEILDGSVSHLRDICFNLMPGVLEKGGVALAIQDLLNRLNCQDKIKATMKIQGKFPRLPQNIEIVLFRITQEFINNMIKHSTATQLRVSLSSTREVVLEMLENGQGFDLSRLDKPGNNRGYANIKSSIHAYGGTMKLESTENGTKLRVIFPKAKPNGKIQA